MAGSSGLGEDLGTMKDEQAERMIEQLEELNSYCKNLGDGAKYSPNPLFYIQTNTRSLSDKAGGMWIMMVGITIALIASVYHHW